MERARVKKIAEQCEMTAVDKVFGNSDLLIKILNLLPPKPLIRSKAVSNHWLALVSDPHFLLNYSRCLYASQPLSSLSQFYYGTEPLSLDGSDELIPKIDHLQGVTDSKLEILNSCNGLILCHHGSGTPLLVVNPTTNKHRLILEPYDYLVRVRGSFLAFDPSQSIHYKVVGLRCTRSERVDDSSWFMSNGIVDNTVEDHVMSIFSSERGSWKEICLPAPADWLDFGIKMVFWRGAIHWINHMNFHVQFHIEEEKFTWNEITIAPKSEYYGYYIAECDNTLLAIKLVIDRYLVFDRHGVFTIFEMKTDSNIWARKHEVELRPLLSEFPKMDNLFDVTVLCVISAVNQETLSLVLAIQGKIILYSGKPENNLYSAKIVKEKPDFKGTYRHFHHYIQCLVPV